MPLQSVHIPHQEKMFLARVMLLEKLNELIDEYNACESSNPTEKLAILDAIQNQIYELDDAQSDNYLTLCPTYLSKIHDQLEQAIREEKLFLNQGLSIADASENTFSSLLMLLEADEANSLTEILLHEQKEPLNEVLAVWSKNLSANKKTQFELLLEQFSIRFLGGFNSKNHLVTNKINRFNCVLKVENRMGNSRLAESRAREHFKDIFTQVYMSKRVWFKEQVNGEMQSRHLQVVEYCPGSDLASYGKNIEQDELKLVSGVSIYLLMAEALEGFHQIGCFFPDMKATNWLIDAQGNIRIADSKSFALIDSDGTISTNTLALNTRYVSAPEMMEEPKNSYDAEKASVYMWAKNLYQHLTGCSVEDFYDKKNEVITDPDLLKFSYPIFKTPKGLMLEQLIRSCLQTNPVNRPSLSDIQFKLKQIDPDYVNADRREMDLIKEEWKLTLESISKCAVNHHDSKLERFLTEQTFLLSQTMPMHDRLLKLKELKSIEQKLTILMSGIEQEVHRLKDKSFDKQAIFLQEQIKEFSIEQRIKILDFDADETESLIRSLETIRREELAIAPENNLYELLEWIQEQRAAKIERSHYQSAYQVFGEYLAEIYQFALKDKDSVLNDYMQMMLKEQKAHNNLAFLEQANDQLKTVIADVKAFRNEIDLAIRLLRKEGGDNRQMITVLQDFMIKIPVPKRNIDTAQSLIWRTKINDKLESVEKLISDSDDLLYDMIANSQISENASVNELKNYYEMFDNIVSTLSSFNQMKESFLEIKNEYVTHQVKALEGIFFGIPPLERAEALQKNPKIVGILVDIHKQISQEMRQKIHSARSENDTKQPSNLPNYYQKR